MAAEQILATAASAGPHTALLPDDVVGTTFYIACNMMLAFTAFFFIQVGQVPKKWKTSVCLAGKPF